MLETLAHHPMWIIAAIALVAFLESFALVGLLLPGVVMLFTLAALAGNLELPMAAVLLAAALGACGGDISSYYLGRWLRPRIDHWRWFERHKTTLQEGQWFFQRWGWLSVVIGRFVGPMRPVVPLIAGTLQMRAGQFIGISLVSVLAWSPVYILPGFLTGEVVGFLENRSLAERALATASLTAGLILLASLTIYHHLHPDHPRTARLLPFVRSFPPDFPFASIALVLGTGIGLIGLTMARPLIWDELLAEGFALTADQTLNTWISAFAMLASPGIMLMVTTLFFTWLAIKGHWLAGLLGALVVPASLWATEALIYQTAVDSASTDTAANLTGFTLLYGLLSATANEGRPSARRWHLYLPFGLVVILMAFSQIWLGTQPLSSVLFGIATGLLISALTRIVYTTFSARRLQLDHSLGLFTLLLLVLICYVWLAISQG